AVAVACRNYSCTGITGRPSGSTPARTVPGNGGAGLAASEGVIARSWSRRCGTGGSGCASDRGESDKADGTGRGIVGPDAPVPSVCRIATASEEPSDRTAGNAPAARRSPLGPAAPRSVGQPDASPGRRDPRFSAPGSRRLTPAWQASEFRGRG